MVPLGSERNDTFLIVKDDHVIIGGVRVRRDGVGFDSVYMPHAVVSIHLTMDDTTFDRVGLLWDWPFAASGLNILRGEPLQNK